MKVSRRFFIWYAFLVSVFLLLSGCMSTTNSVNNNIASIYNRNMNVINPKYKVFHHSDRQSTVYFSLPSTQLLYSKKDYDSTYTAHVRIHYELYNELTPKVISDSNTVYILDENPTFVSKLLFGEIEIPMQQGYDYKLLITFVDENRSQSITKQLEIDKSNRNAPEYFLIKKRNGAIVFKPFVSENDTVWLHYADTTLKELMVKHYAYDFGMAPPPFSVDEQLASWEMSFHPDTTYTLLKSNLGFMFVPYRGVFHFQQNPANNTGLNLYQFTDNYPQVAELQTMIEALRYITTKKEYEAIIYSKNRKESFEKFWLSLGGNKARAKQLIRAYYGRVEQANKLFSSYKEGWKTDRGMVYIIYGEPNIVYQSDDGESWIYGEEDNLLSINFIFYRINNPLSENDYRLKRLATYKTSWYRMVDIWRQGRIY